MRGSAALERQDLDLRSSCWLGHRPSPASSVSALVSSRAIVEPSFTAAAGATVFVPPHVPHAFASRGEADATFLLTVSPPGHDRYFDELADIPAADGPPDPDAIAKLRERYDTRQIETLTTR